jgi:hypothetical protein
MSENLNDVLQELSALLRRISDQNDVSLKRQEELRSKELRSKEDVQFRERLLQTLEHHNQLLESLIARLKDSPKKG